MYRDTPRNIYASLSPPASSTDPTTSRPYPYPTSARAAARSAEPEVDPGFMSPNYTGWAPTLSPVRGSPAEPFPGEFPEDEGYAEEGEYEEHHMDQDGHRVYDGDGGVNANDAQYDAYNFPERELVEPEDSATMVPHGGDAARKQELSGSGESYDASQSPIDEPHRSLARRFVGGFISGLRTIPRAMLKNNPRGAIPSFHSSPGDVGSPQLHRNMSPMPVQMPVPPDDQGVTYSTMHPPSLRPTSEEPSPTFQYHDREEESSSSGQERPDIDPRIPHHFSRYDMNITQDESELGTPEHIAREEVTDYETSRQLYPFTNPADDSWGSYLDRIHRFFTDIVSLPWVTTQISSDYVPAVDSSRGRYRQSESPTSWYSPKTRKRGQDLEEPPPLPSMSYVLSTNEAGSVIAQPMSYISNPTPLQPHIQPSSHASFVPIASASILIQTIPPTPTASNAPSMAPSTNRFSYYTRRTNDPLLSPSGAGTPYSGSQATTMTQNDGRLTLTASSPPYTPRSEGGVTAIRPLRTPVSLATSLAAAQSPGASSHGMGNHSMTYSMHYPSPSYITGRFTSRGGGQSSVLDTPFGAGSDGMSTPRAYYNTVR
ncbi:hypothetical protein C8Q75DRAFT_808000 [Abortiporus biennis]|nr:hypothetical protein C8Q75DRAFT_808000 [Abortiporus biennis]